MSEIIGYKEWQWLVYLRLPVQREITSESLRHVNGKLDTVQRHVGVLGCGLQPIDQK